MCLFAGIIISYYLMFIPTFLLITIGILIIRELYIMCIRHLHMIECDYKGYYMDGCAYKGYYMDGCAFKEYDKEYNVDKCAYEECDEVESNQMIR